MVVVVGVGVGDRRSCCCCCCCCCYNYYGGSFSSYRRRRSKGTPAWWKFGVNRFLYAKILVCQLACCEYKKSYRGCRDYAAGGGCWRK